MKRLRTERIERVRERTKERTRERESKIRSSDWWIYFHLCSKNFCLQKTHSHFASCHNLGFCRSMRCLIFRNDQTGASKKIVACNKSVRKICLQSRLWMNSFMFCDFICCSFVFLFRRHCSWHFSWSKKKETSEKKELKWFIVGNELKTGWIENAMAMTGFGSFSLWSQWVMVEIRARRLRLRIRCARLQVNGVLSSNKTARIFEIETLSLLFLSWKLHFDSSLVERLFQSVHTAYSL